MLLGGVLVFRSTRSGYSIFHNLLFDVLGLIAVHLGSSFA